MRELGLAVFGEYPLKVVDVGAAGGAQPELEAIEPFIDFLGFDADRDECERLNRKAAEEKRRMRIEPYVVAGDDAERPFYVCRGRDASSLLKPNTAHYAAFADPERHDIVEVETVQTHHFGRLLLELGTSPEYLKLDVHGIEPELLSSLSDQQWGSLLAVYTEVLFAYLFIGQGEFGDIDAILRARGFRAIQLSRGSNRRTSIDPAVTNSRGQLTMGNALYVRDASQLDDSQRRRLAAITVLFGHYAFALDLLRDDPALTQHVVEISQRTRLSRALANPISRLGRLIYVIGPRRDAWTSSDATYEWL